MNNVTSVWRNISYLGEKVFAVFDPGVEYTAHNQGRPLLVVFDNGRCARASADGVMNDLDYLIAGEHHPFETKMRDVTDEWCDENSIGDHVFAVFDIGGVRLNGAMLLVVILNNCFQFATLSGACDDSWVYLEPKSKPTPVPPLRFGDAVN